MPLISLLSCRFRRYLLIVAGGVALLLGLIGAVVPGLPTTPFILLAAGCFSRASPALHRWLLRQPGLGRLVADWERHHSLPRRIKWLAIGMMAVMVVLSVSQLAGHFWLQGGIAGLGLLGCIMVWRIPDRV